MYANYRPSSREALLAFPLPPPDFAYGEAYPGSVVPIVTNFAPRMWSQLETVEEKPSCRQTGIRVRF